MGFLFFRPASHLLLLLSKLAVIQKALTQNFVTRNSVTQNIVTHTHTQLARSLALSGLVWSGLSVTYLFHLYFRTQLFHTLTQSTVNDALFHTALPYRMLSQKRGHTHTHKALSSTTLSRAATHTHAHSDKTWSHNSVTYCGVTHTHLCQTDDIATKSVMHTTLKCKSVIHNSVADARNFVTHTQYRWVCST